MKVACIIFAKSPISGFTKTRLARDLGEDVTLRLYRLMLRWQWENLQAVFEQSKKKRDIYQTLNFMHLYF